MGPPPKAAPGRPATIDAPRETILGVAARLFAQKGYEGTSLQEIAASVGLSKAAVYHYFPSKQVIYDAIVEDLLQRLHDRARAAIEAGSDPADALRSFMIAHAEFFEESFTEFVTLLHGIGGARGERGAAEIEKRDAYERMLRDLIAVGIASGAFAARDPVVVARAVLSLLNGMSRWYRPDGPRRARSFAEDYFDLLYAGLQLR